MININEQKIIKSWEKNARPWLNAVRKGEIESRLLITNKAILDVILKHSPQTVLDLGCGEGWLIRELAKSTISSLGIDIVPELINRAKQAGGGRFSVLSFNQIANNILNEKFDAIICNFSLFGKESVNRLFKQIPNMLNPDGLFIVQTIHPITGCANNNYKDAWREGSWTGFSKQFSDPAPWYFRTLESWKSLFIDNGFNIKIIEPVNPKTKVNASIIFVGQINTA